MFFKFLFLLLILYVALKIVRIVLVRTIEKSAKKVFKEEFHLIAGSSMFSIQSLVGKGEFFDITLKNMEFHLNISSMFGFANTPIIDLSFDYLFIKINKLPTSKSQSKPQSFEAWAMLNLLFVLILNIFRKFSLNFNNFIFQFKGFSITFQECLIFFRKHKKNINASINLLNLILRKKEILLRVPMLKCDVLLTSFTLKSLIASLLKDIQFKLPMIEINYNSGMIDLSIAQIEAQAASDSSADLKIKINPIKAIAPSISTFTKAINARIKNIESTSNGIKIGDILVKNKTETLVNIPTVELNDKDLTIPTVKSNISTPLLIDLVSLISLLPRKPLDPWNPDTIDLPVNARINEAFVRLNLSDEHIFEFEGKKISTSRATNSVFISKLEFYPIVLGSKMNMASASQAKIVISKENSFKISLKYINFNMFTDFNFLNYLKSAAIIMKYIANTFKGPKHVVNPEEPPTPFLITLKIKTAVMNMIKRSICDTIEKSIESKRVAMEGLQLRQHKAVQILKASGVKTIKMELFENKSKEMLWKLYRQTFESATDENRAAWAIFTQITLAFDGLRFKTAEEMLDTVCSMLPTADRNQIGLMDGGGITMRADKAEFHISRFGKIGEVENLKTDGIFIMAPPNFSKTHQLFNYNLSFENESIKLEIPDLADAPAMMYKGNSSISQVDVRFAGPVLEFFDNMDFAISDAFYKLTKFKDVASFDVFRLVFHFIGVVDVNNITVQMSDNSQPFFKAPNLEVDIPHINFEYNGNYFIYSIDPIRVNYLGEGFPQRVLKLPASKIIMKFISLNMIGKTNDPPLFFNIDTSRMLDHKYDPYENYRTTMFNIELNVDFTVTSEFGSINFDMIQPLIDTYLANFNKYITTVKFVAPPVGYLQFSKMKATVKLPQFTISMFKRDLSIIVSPFACDLSVSLKKKQAEITVAKIDAIFSQLGQNSGVVTCQAVTLHFNDQTLNLTADQITCDIKPTILTMLLQVKLNVPKKKDVNQTKVPSQINNTNIDEFARVTNKTQLSIKKVILHLLLDNSNFPPTVTFSNLSFGILVNNNNEGIMLLEFERFQICTSAYMDHPLVESNNLRLFFAADESQLSLFLQMNGSTECSLCPGDFDIIIPQIKMILPAALALDNGSDKEKKSGQKTALSIVVQVEHSIIFNFMKSDNTPLAMAVVTGFDLTHIATGDGAEDTKMTLLNLQFTDETSKDEFHEVFNSIPSAEPAFKMLIKQRKKSMKCPVYNIISFGLQPFKLRISLKFIDDMIKLYPSASDLNIFDFDQAEFADREKEKEKNEMLNTKSKQIYIAQMSNTDDQILGFYRKVNIDPFSATMSYLGLPESFIHELHDWQLNFGKIELLDLFGTKEQLKEALLKEVKWTLIKTLTKMALRMK